jgi:hypothetical protein
MNDNRLDSTHVPPIWTESQIAAPWWHNGARVFFFAHLLTAAILVALVSLDTISAWWLALAAPCWVIGMGMVAK